jgi:hypothetical protein
MSDNSIYQELKKGMDDLQKNIDKYPKGSCEITALEVLKDQAVQDAFVDLIRQGYDFKQVSCKGEHDQIKVTFTFSCRPPRICIVNQCIDVLYDPVSHKVGPPKQTICEGLVF